MTNGTTCRTTTSTATDCPKTHCTSCTRHRDDGTTLRTHIPDGTQTCTPCLAETRAWLKQLPDQAAYISQTNTGRPTASPGISANTSRSADTPLPGGDRLTLISPGSTGRNALGHPHHADNKPTDTQSAITILENWEADLRRARGHAAATTNPTVTNTTQYLLKQLDWAAQHYPRFHQLHNAIRKLHTQLTQAAGHSARPVTGIGTCLHCNTRLQRHWTKTGLAEQWDCPACKRTYTPAEYNFAIRAALETTG